MQDGASGHAAHGTIKNIRTRGITIIDWSSYSSDLNPIETIWNIMKDYI